MSTHDDALGPLVERIATRTAELVTDRLLGGSRQDTISHRESPIGSRRFIGAIRSGRMPGVKVGRLWLARRTDHDSYIASIGIAADKPRRSRAAELEAAINR